MILDRSGRSSVIRAGLLVLVAAFLLVLSIADARVADAHEDAAQHGGIELTPEAPEWTDDGEYLKFHLRITDEHPEDISIPEGELAWAYKWFSYKHVEGGQFGCTSEFFEIESRLRLEEWLEENDYGDDIYETQKDIFQTNGIFLSVFPQDDGSYKSSFTLSKKKSDLSRYVNDEGKLAICFEIKYDDGSHASLSRIIVDFSDFANSQIDTDLSEDEANSSAVSSDAAAQPDTAGEVTNQSVGGIGGGPGQEDLPGTGLVEDSDDSLLLTAAVSSAVIVALALLSILYRAKRHRRQKS